MVEDEDWSLSVFPRAFWHSGIPPTGSLVIVTVEERLVMTRYAALSIHSRSTSPERRQARFMTVVGFERVTLGEPWIYRHFDGDVVTEDVTSPVEEIWEVAGALASASAVGVPVGEGTVRRTSEPEIWVGDEIGSTATVLVTTIGDWDGVWMLAGDGSGYRFVPADPNRTMQSWRSVLCNGWIRVGQTLWLDKEIAPGVWGKVDPVGCGTVMEIVVEELVSSGAPEDTSG